VHWSLDNNLVLVILLMLEGTAAPDSDIKYFYRRCHERHLAGPPCTLCNGLNLCQPDQALAIISV
jgi:hypothetical protein